MLGPCKRRAEEKHTHSHSFSQLPRPIPGKSLRRGRWGAGALPSLLPAPALVGSEGRGTGQREKTRRRQPRSHDGASGGRSGGPGARWPCRTALLRAKGPIQLPSLETSALLAQEGQREEHSSRLLTRPGGGHRLAQRYRRTSSSLATAPWPCCRARSTDPVSPNSDNESRKGATVIPGWGNRGPERPAAGAVSPAEATTRVEPGHSSLHGRKRVCLAEDREAWRHAERVSQCPRPSSAGLLGGWLPHVPGAPSSRNASQHCSGTRRLTLRAEGPSSCCQMPTSNACRPNLSAEAGSRAPRPAHGDLQAHSPPAPAAWSLSAGMLVREVEAMRLEELLH